MSLNSSNNLNSNANNKLTFKGIKMDEFIISPDMFSKEQIDYIMENYFGYWVDALHGCGDKFFSKQLGRECTYEEEAEIFLALFKRMIDEGLILVAAPIKGEPEKELQGDMFWDVPSDKMIEYIRRVFPSNLKFLYGYPEDVNDEWGKFWYEDCPEIRWVDKETGKIY